MKKILQLLFISVFVYSLIGLSANSVYAQECDASNISNITKMSLDELTRMGNKCNEALSQMEKAVKPHVDELQKMDKAIAAFQARIKTIETDVSKKVAAIIQGEKELEGSLTLAGGRIRQFYIRSYTTNPISLFFSSENIGSVLRTVAYQQAAVNEDKKVITQTALSVKDLEDKKKALEQEKNSLAALKADTDRRAESVRKLVAESNAYTSKLRSAIAAITAAQQQFLAAKLSGLGLPTSLGAGPLFCTDDRKLDPGFSPAFAFFTFGIPHRVGMNQYGAYGRATFGGQGHEEILRAYFANFNFETRPNVEIDVQGYRRMPLETYLLGIYEMPESWPPAALEAQAIAARSYALAYTNNGANPICTSQSCQVYKEPHKSGAWKTAVEKTAGKVIVSGGTVVTAWYSSTDGGYTFANNDVWGGSQRGWTKRTRDTNGDVSSFEDLRSKSYDRDSPCLYAAQGWRTEYAKSAWIKSDELADIANVILLARQDSGVREHLYQTDKPNPAGTETWSRDRVKQELRNRNMTPFNSVNSANISGVDWGSGITTGIRVSGDAGTQSFDGSEFKSYFNLRAPANIQIVGPLYNVEKR